MSFLDLFVILGEPAGVKAPPAGGPRGEAPRGAVADENKKKPIYLILKDLNLYVRTQLVSGG